MAGSRCTRFWACAERPLVVLSACDTAWGRLLAESRPATTSWGLTRRFLFAGSPSVVASLWAATTGSTLRLMSGSTASCSGECLSRPVQMLGRGFPGLSRVEGSLRQSDGLAERNGPG